MKTNKVLAALALAVATSATLTTFAASVAKVGDAEYDSLQTAFDNASGKTVTLLANVTNDTLTVTGTVTINGGKTLTFKKLAGADSTAKLRLAGISLSNASTGTSEIAVNLEVSTEGENVLYPVYTSSPSEQVYIKVTGNLCGNGTLKQRTGNSYRFVTLTGDNHEFAGTLEFYDTANYVNGFNSSGTSSNAVWNINQNAANILNNNNQIRYWLDAGTNPNYYFGALNGNVQFRAMYYDATAEVGWRNDVESSFGGYLTSNNKYLSIRKIGSNKLTFTGTQMGGLEIKGGNVYLTQANASSGQKALSMDAGTLLDLGGTTQTFTSLVCFGVITNGTLTIASTGTINFGGGAVVDIGNKELSNGTVVINYTGTDGRKITGLDNVAITANGVAQPSFSLEFTSGTGLTLKNNGGKTLTIGTYKTIELSGADTLEEAIVATNGYTIALSSERTDAGQSADYFKLTLIEESGVYYVSYALDENVVMPTLNSAGAFSVSDTTASFAVGNVKPGLWYSVVSSGNVAADKYNYPKESQASAWKQPTDAADLNLELQLPTDSNVQFYKIAVDDVTPEWSAE